METYSGSQVVPWGQIDGCGKAKSHFLQQRLKTSNNILITDDLESRFKNYSFKTPTVLCKIATFVTIILMEFLFHSASKSLETVITYVK